MCDHVQRKALLGAAILLVAGCGSTSEAPDTHRMAFFDHFLDQCEGTYRGAAELSPGSDRLFGSADLSLHLEDCSESEIWIGFGVDDDRSRRWLLRREGHELLFLQFSGERSVEAGGGRKGGRWGGWASDQGTELIQHFPDHGARPGQGSLQGVREWTLRIDPLGDRVVYEMSRGEQVRYRFIFHRDGSPGP